MAITEEIQLRALAFVNAFYSSVKKIDVSNPYFSDRAPLHPLYEEVTENEREIAVHFEWGFPPNELITSYRPNEPKKVKEYRISTYQQTTYPVLQKANGLIKGALSNHQVFYIQWPKNDILKEGDSLEDYAKMLPTGVSLDSYFWEFITPRGVAYPNSFVAVIPETPDYERMPEDEDDFRKPIPTYIPSEFVLDYGTNYALVLSSDTTTIRTSKQGVIEGQIYFLFLPFQTLQIVQTGEDSQGRPKWEVLEYHSHGWEKPAFRQIGGVVSGTVPNVLSRKKTVLHMSHLQGMIPHLNNAVRQKSDIEAARVAHLHPVRYEEPIECPNCDHGKTTEGETCGTCSGTGYLKPVNTPLEAITKEADEKGVLHAPVGFVSPPTDTFESSVAGYEAEIESAYEAADMEVLYSGIGSQQTARAKEIDRENLHNRLHQIGGTIYPLYQWILDAVTFMRYSALLGVDVLDEYRAEVHKPNTFDTTNFTEEVERLTEMKTAGVPASSRTLVAERVVSKAFGANTMSAKLGRAYLICNPFAMLTIDEVMALTALDMQQTEEEKIQIYLYQNVGWLVDARTSLDKSFLDLSPQEMREEITAFAKERMKESNTLPAPPENDPAAMVANFSQNGTSN